MENRIMETFKTSGVCSRFINFEVENGKVKYVSVGKGTVPVKECVKLMKNGGFKGPYTLEWVRATHPELEPLENVLLSYKTFINSIK